MTNSQTRLYQPDIETMTRDDIRFAAAFKTAKAGTLRL